VSARTPTRHRMNNAMEAAHYRNVAAEKALANAVSALLEVLEEPSSDGKDEKAREGLWSALAQIEYVDE
jgi:hypothetical protein